MKRLLLLLALSAICFFASKSFAQEKFDPAGRAKLIAPFIGEQTIAVVHVDISRIKIDKLSQMAAQLVPEEKSQIAEIQAQFKSVKESFLKAGGKDIYLVVQAATFLPPKVVI
ncbi:MAG: hypothetical protein ACWGMZ_08400, partial [Thermoguttaceae bacterium]